MKARKIWNAFAVATLGLGMVSCSPTESEFTEKLCSLAEEAAELLLDCKEWDEAIDVGDDLHELADDMAKLAEDCEKAIVAILEEEGDMTETEYKDHKELLKTRRQHALEALQKAEAHIDANEAGKSKYLRMAIGRIKKYL